jgi:hypothetical protein
MTPRCRARSAAEPTEPEWSKVDAAQFRSEEEVKSDVAGAGWGLRRLKLRAVSAFEHMSEEVVEAGIAGIAAALPSLGDGSQYETSDMLVFQKPLFRRGGR